jgi:hypothetical protein
MAELRPGASWQSFARVLCDDVLAELWKSASWRRRAGDGALGGGVVVTATAAAEACCRPRLASLQEETAVVGGWIPLCSAWAVRRRQI